MNSTEIQEQSADARESADPKIEEAARRHETEVREAVEGVTVESVVQRISGLGLEVSKALSGLSGKLTEEVQLLASVREAVGLERKELDRLHNIDVAATALDQLVQDYARQKQELETEIAARRARGKRKPRAPTANAKNRKRPSGSSANGKAKISSTRRHRSARRLRISTTKRFVSRKRRTRKSRRRLEKSWQLREAALKEREEELARLRKEAEAFPKRLETEAAAAAERARREAEARLQQETLVMKKDAEAEKRFGELRVKTLEETVAHQQAQIAALEKQLADAKQQVQDIAVKAIEGASGARALSHINQIAMEQAKNRPQG